VCGERDRPPSSKDNDAAGGETLGSSPRLAEPWNPFSAPKPASGHIVDFVCLKQRLVVEVDGGQHALNQQRALDETRDHTLSEKGFRILRFWNSDIDRNLSGVLAAIDSELRTPPGQPDG
jgi:very-short-patch-repair endonuclease